eukprot:GHVU01022939.1.p1 GENE.GHVU01022939.1~~GHVU01022939.1.p1  ORF type:complete len:143 (+),score=26.83 GHVU01022939.1:301-729(+)
MDKYRKVQRPPKLSPEEEIRVTGTGFVSSYVRYASKLLGEREKSRIAIRATGKAMSTAVTVAEIVKHQHAGLHQVTSIGSTEIVEEYEPLEEGLDYIKEKRQVPYIDINLAKNVDELDTSAPGYQEPLDKESARVMGVASVH